MQAIADKRKSRAQTPAHAGSAAPAARLMRQSIRDHPIPTTPTRRCAYMKHAHDPADSDDDVARATPEEQPTARSGPTSPGNADDARLSATSPSEARSGLTRTEQSDRWPLG
jgi:hypothetical protein